MRAKLLIIDGDRDYIKMIRNLLISDYDIISASDEIESLNQIKSEQPDVVILDLAINNTSNSLNILKKIKNTNKDMPVIIMTGNSSLQLIVKAIRLGAIYCIEKTYNRQKLNFSLKKSLTNWFENLKKQKLILQKNVKNYRLIGNSKAIKEIEERINLISNNQSTVLITGETGVGKENVARQVHIHRNGNNKPFISINCGAIPDRLIESELFGHEPGSFTGAQKRKKGKFEIANNGIIFFDEISELKLDSQVKLLRVIQEKRFERLGGNQNIDTNAKIIAATNQDLQDRVEQGTFRQDLFMFFPSKFHHCEVENPIYLYWLGISLKIYPKN